MTTMIMILSSSFYDLNYVKFINYIIYYQQILTGAFIFTAGTYRYTYLSAMFILNISLDKDYELQIMCEKFVCIQYQIRFKT